MLLSVISFSHVDSERKNPNQIPCMYKYTCPINLILKIPSHSNTRGQCHLVGAPSNCQNKTLWNDNKTKMIFYSSWHPSCFWKKLYIKFMLIMSYCVFSVIISMHSSYNFLSDKIFSPSCLYLLICAGAYISSLIPTACLSCSDMQDVLPATGHMVGMCVGGININLCQGKLHGTAGGSFCLFPFVLHDDIFPVWLDESHLVRRWCWIQQESARVTAGAA